MRIKKTNNSQTRTPVHTCQNHRNVALVKKLLTKTRFHCAVITVLLSLLLYQTHCRIYKTAEYFLADRKALEKSLVSWVFSFFACVCITLIKTKMGNDLKKLFKRTRKLFEDYDQDCIRIWGDQLGSWKKRSRYQNSGRLISHLNRLIIQQESRKNSFPSSWSFFSVEDDTPSLSHR